MLRLWSRLPAAVLLAALAACSGSAGLMPAQQRGVNAAKTAPATFTIHWTNPSAPAWVRHRDVISPSAQSIAALVNGTLNTVANRNGSPSQTMTLIAPVGDDQFVFNVYDAPNAQGRLLGSATVTDDVVDGAANTVSATIQAACAVTNVSEAGDPLAAPTYTTPPGIASTLASIVVAGQSSATLTVGPEDADGNVIISGTGGVVQATITGSATITPVDGAHIKLTPTTGPRKTTADTLTVAAPSCPTTTVSVQHSPAIFVENTNDFVTVEDWYGDQLETGALAPGDKLIGYDTVLKTLMTYNAGTGNINQYALNFSGGPTILATAPTGGIATWSTFLHAALVTVPGGDSQLYFPFFAGAGTYVAFTFSGTVTATTASTLTISPNSYFSVGPQTWWFTWLSRTVANFGDSGLVSAVALATDDNEGVLYAFASSTPYVTRVAQPGLGSPSTGNYGFTAAPVAGGADTDGDNIYAVLSTGAFVASSYGGSPLTGGNFGASVGTGLAITVLSTNEQ